MFPSTEYEVVAQHPNTDALPPLQIGTFSIQDASAQISDLKALGFEIVKVNVNSL